MKRMTWAVLAAAGVSSSVPALAYDPPPAVATEQGREGEELIREQEAEAAAFQATSTGQVVEARSGAGSMEPGDPTPADPETDEERVERDFVTSVWNSP